jgi:F420H(2)-dependent quinone reductase
MGRLHASLWKLSGGKLGNQFGRVPFMMLTTTGRKTGRPRTTPVLYFQDGADLIIVASFGGNDVHPGWYLNLERCREAEVLLNGTRRPAFRQSSLCRGEKSYLAKIDQNVS